MPIKVNEFEISDDQIHEEMQQHPAHGVDGARNQAAEALVVRCLLLDEGVRQQMLPSMTESTVDEQERAIENLLKNNVTVPDADDETCSRYYQQNIERFADQKSGETLPLELVKDNIQKYLQAKSMRAGVSYYIQSLAAKAKIVGFSLGS